MYYFGQIEVITGGCRRKYFWVRSGINNWKREGRGAVLVSEVAVETSPNGDQLWRGTTEKREK